MWEGERKAELNPLHGFLLLNCFLSYSPFSFYNPMTLIPRLHLKTQTNSNQNKTLGNMHVHPREGRLWCQKVYLFPGLTIPSYRVGGYLPGLILGVKHSRHYFLCLIKVKHLFMSFKFLIPQLKIR